MKRIPLFANLEGRRCLIVSYGSAALEEAKLLYTAGACIFIVGSQIGDALIELAQLSKGTVHLRPYASTDLIDVALVIAASDQPDINTQISKDALIRCIPVNVIGNSALSSVTIPITINRDPLRIAIGYGDEDKILAQHLYTKLEYTIPRAYGHLAYLIRRQNTQIEQLLPEPNKRKLFWDEVLNGPIAELALAGQDKIAESKLIGYLDRSQPYYLNSGEVYLVGAGPGDPDLLTFKALRLIQKADVVLYDRLVAREIVELAPRDAERIYVGKARSQHAMPQQKINQLLVDLALEGKKVLRLKGGDPFIFGRGGEELEKLAQHRIPFQVVPGVTAASGCAAYCGIPLTHREYAQSVRFIAGHLKDDTNDLPWSELAKENQTLVFYMGLSGAKTICQQLILSGRAPNTPIALIQRGTTTDQRVIVGTLMTMPALIQNENIKPPTLIIVGEVVNLRKSLNWIEQNELQRM